MIITDFDRISKWFEDDLSKEIYNAVALNRLFGRFENLADIIEKQYPNRERNDIVKFYKENHYNQNNSMPISVFGAGKIGKYTLDILSNSNIKIESVVDNYSSAKQLLGIPVVKFDDVSNEKSRIYLIAAIGTKKYEIFEQLEDTGVKKERIFFVENYFGDQYFEDSIIKKGKDDVFIDGGAFNGSTAIMFSNWVHGEYKKIYSFEPDKENCKVIEKNFAENAIEKTTLVQCGLWDKKGTLYFRENGTAGSMIDIFGETKVNVTSIDEELNEEKPTFIKMDIEGAELKALQGARETIKKYKPQLAICIYHKPEDLLEIPVFIKELIPEYKLYLRHYSSLYYETVLYATL